MRCVGLDGHLLLTGRWTGFQVCRSRRIAHAQTEAMMTVMYVLGPGGIAVPESDAIERAKKFKATQRHVAVTEIGESRISTVFLGVDHVLWETMIFGGPLDGEQRRYSAKEDAERGHNEFVGRLTRDALPRKPFTSL